MLERLESIRRGENGGKTLEGKKKKMRSKPHECMRMCVIVGKSDWTRVHARKDHERET